MLQEAEDMSGKKHFRIGNGIAYYLLKSGGALEGSQRRGYDPTPGNCFLGARAKYFEGEGELQVEAGK